MFKKELTALLRHKKIVAGLFIALFIPTMYCAMFLWAFWDPYDKMNVIRVAVVNEDEPIVHQGEKLQLGNNIVKSIEKNKTFNWEFVSREKAIKGMEVGKYSMTIIIPKDFTKHVNALPEGNVERPVIQYIPNESMNYMMSMIESGMIKELGRGISVSIVESYLETMYDMNRDVQNGMNELSGHLNNLAIETEDLQPVLRQVIMTNTALSDTEKEQLIKSVLTMVESTEKMASDLEETLKDTASTHLENEQIQLVADPVKLETDPYTEVSNYGHGFVPFTLSLGLFIGAMVVAMVFPPVQTLLTPNSLTGWLGSKYTVIFLLAIFQGLIANLVLLFGLGVEVENVGYFMLLTTIVSITFVTIAHMCMAIFKEGGRLLIVMMIIFQLTSSGGTFPTEMVPSFLQKISIIMPMTYSIAGFRSLIGTENISLLWQNIGYLSIFFMLAVISSIIYFAVSYKRMSITETEEVKIM